MKAGRVVPHSSLTHVLGRRSLTLLLPGIPPGLNGPSGLIRAHWGALMREKERWEQMILLARDYHRLSFEHCEITYRVFSRKPMDWDNAAASFKFVGDGLKRAQLIRDDNPSVVRRLVVEQSLAVTASDVRIEITLTDA